MTLHVEGAVGEHAIVELRGHRPESNLIFTQKVVDIGPVPVGTPQKATAVIRNIGESDAMFQASPACVGPLQASISQQSVADLTMKTICRSCQMMFSPSCQTGRESQRGPA